MSGISESVKKLRVDDNQIPYLCIKSETLTWQQLGIRLQQNDSEDLTLDRCIFEGNVDHLPDLQLLKTFKLEHSTINWQQFMQLLQKMRNLVTLTIAYCDFEGDVAALEDNLDLMEDLNIIPYAKMTSQQFAFLIQKMPNLKSVIMMTGVNNIPAFETNFLYAESLNLSLATINARDLLLFAEKMPNLKKLLLNFAQFSNLSASFPNLDLVKELQLGGAYLWWQDLVAMLRKMKNIEILNLNCIEIKEHQYESATELEPIEGSAYVLKKINFDQLGFILDNLNNLKSLYLAWSWFMPKIKEDHQYILYDVIQDKPAFDKIKLAHDNFSVYLALKIVFGVRILKNIPGEIFYMIYKMLGKDVNPESFDRFTVRTLQNTPIIKDILLAQFMYDNNFSIFKSGLNAIKSQGSKQGFTPLTWAAQRGFSGAVRRLVDEGADPEYPDGNYNTAETIAIAQGNKPLMAFFEARNQQVASSSWATKAAASLQLRS